MANPIPFEPASCGICYTPYLVTGCKYVHSPNPEGVEILDVISMPLQAFMQAIREGLGVDSKTLAITMLALPHLGYRF